MKNTLLTLFLRFLFWMGQGLAKHHWFEMHLHHLHGAHQQRHNHIMCTRMSTLELNYIETLLVLFWWMIKGVDTWCQLYAGVQNMAREADVCPKVCIFATTWRVTSFESYFLKPPKNGRFRKRWFFLSKLGLTFFLVSVSFLFFARVYIM